VGEKLASDARWTEVRWVRSASRFSERGLNLLLEFFQRRHRQALFADALQVRLARLLLFAASPGGSNARYNWNPVTDHVGAIHETQVCKLDSSDDVGRGVFSSRR
jgi:hypothetical protein